MIPKIIHNIWIQGYHDLPNDIKVDYLKIKKLNPDWDFMIWDDKMIIQLLEKHPPILKVYKGCSNLPGIIGSSTTQSDIARYVIMKEYGGIYYDFDFKCRKSFDTLLKKEVVSDLDILTISSEIGFLTYIYPFQQPKYCSCFMGLQKNHPIWEKVLKVVENATSKKEIGEAFDQVLQKNEELYNIIILQKVKGHYGCDSENMICETTPSSSWNFIRPFLQFFNCNVIKILLVILVIIIVILLHYRSYYNVFFLKQNIPINNVIPGLGPASQTQSMKRGKNKKSKK